MSCPTNVDIKEASWQQVQSEQDTSHASVSYVETRHLYPRAGQVPYGDDQNGGSPTQGLTVVLRLCSPLIGFVMQQGTLLGTAEPDGGSHTQCSMLLFAFHPP